MNVPESTEGHAVRFLQQALLKTLALILASFAWVPMPAIAQVRPDGSTGGGTSGSTPPPEDPSNPREDNPRNPESLSLSDLVLELDNPRLEIAENRAYIPLFFSIKSPYSGFFSDTNEILVRATFVSGTATPGKDFDISVPVRRVPPGGGLNSLNWVELPLIQDEENEGTETALFDLSIDGSTNAPLRVEVSILDDLNPGEVGFISPRFQINEGSTNGYAEIRLWRTLNTRNTASVTYRLEGSPSALAILGGQTHRTAVFAPGDSQAFLRIPLVNNAEAQGNQDVTLTIETSDDGMKIMKGFGSTVLTLADDETLPSGSALSVFETSDNNGTRGVVLSTQVPRGYQVRLEYSDNGTAGPWELHWILEGADTDRHVFNSFSASVMRMFRILPPEPLNTTFPW